jgi:hypothetical protein
LQLRLALVEWFAATYVQEASLRLLTCREVPGRVLNWCAQQQAPIVTLSLPDAPALSIKQRQEAQRDGDARIESASWLCGILSLMLRVFATADKDSTVRGQAARIRDSMAEAVKEIVEVGVGRKDRWLLYSSFAETAKACLSGNTEECLLWCAATDLVYVQPDSRVNAEVHNRLVVRAWELREASGGDTNRDTALLMTVPYWALPFSPELSTVIDCMVDAQVERLLLSELGYRTSTASAEESLATNDANSQLRYSYEFSQVYVEHVRDRGASKRVMTTISERGPRAMLACRWYAAAAHAALAQQWEVHATFIKAARYVKETPLINISAKENGYEDKLEFSDEQRPVATRAGERFARAAEALQAGDRELYEMWLRAAEATMAALTDSDAREGAEALAQAAQRQDAVQAHRSSAGGNSTAETNVHISEAATEELALGSRRKAQEARRSGVNSVQVSTVDVILCMRGLAASYLEVNSTVR